MNGSTKTSISPPHGQAEAPGLVVADAVGDELRASARRTGSCPFADVGLDAAARDGAEHAAVRRDRELRAERPRGAAACPDDGRERDVLACCAPLLCLCEHLVHVAMMPAMDDPPEDGVDELLARLDAGELGDPLPVLAYLAGRAVLDRRGGAERRPAPRRAARRRGRRSTSRAGGRRPRRQVARRGSLRQRAADRSWRGASMLWCCACATCLSSARPRSSSSADVDLAWRMFTLALLAEELGE